jgi:purine nucleosidase
MTPTKIILDCDPGHDDALAIMLADGNDALDLLAVTTVSGNQDLQKVTYNARVVATVIGMHDVPIAAGADQPLIHRPVYADDIHGESGLGGPVLPEPTVPLDPRHAVDLIIELIMGSEPGEITLIGVGPATNLALALRREPAIARRVREVVLMGGAFTRGNVTPAAEFNVYADPHAAAAVLQAPWRVTLIGLDLTHQATATPDIRAKIAGIGTRPARFTSELLSFFATAYEKDQDMPDPPIHDPCAVAYVIDPKVMSTRRAHVAVELTGAHTTGMTVIDFTERSGPRDTAVATTLDRNRFWELMTGSIEAIGEPDAGAT